MTASALPVPGPVWGPYPENPQPWPEQPALERRLRQLGEPLRRWQAERRQSSFVERVRAVEDGLAADDAGTLGERIRQVRLDLRRNGLAEAQVAPALAVIGACCQRALQRRPFAVQLIAARIVLDGGLAEMATGEGKTLTVGLAAACGALAGMPVHVLTANDYLVTRDATTLAPLYALLGLSVATVTAATSPAERHRAYTADIVYATAKELVFDSLRDALAPPAAGLHWHAKRLLGDDATPALRGLCYAILDEADSILIDEARVPLILSQAEPNAAEGVYLQQALALARGLKAGRDFSLQRRPPQAALTPAGCERITRAADWLGLPWRNRAHRESLVTLALGALHTLQRDRDYLLVGGGVQLIDPGTGRTAPGRAWSQGLHQLVELKEGCAPTAAACPRLATTYQRFFARYVRLGGLSGTLHEARGELFNVYGLGVRRVPLRRPSRRLTLAPQLFADHNRLWQAVSARIRELVAGGRPVLVGTESVADSEALASHLSAAGIAHTLLNARHDSDEAAIVAAAGQPGQVTVATNMAGRGTDIVLAPGVAARGGLHIINCQLNDARRIDRQLIGRCARQGDPGSVETWLSLDSRLLREGLPPTLRRWLQARCPISAPRLLRGLFGGPQRRREADDRVQRQRLQTQTQRQNRQLGFSATRE